MLWVNEEERMTPSRVVRNEFEIRMFERASRGRLAQIGIAPH